MNNSFDKFLITVIFTLIIAVILYLVLAWIPQQLERTDRARTWAANNNCEYLGSPRDLNSLMFFDCNGVISVQRFKLED